MVLPGNCGPATVGKGFGARRVRENEQRGKNLICSEKLLLLAIHYDEVHRKS